MELEKVVNGPISPVLKGPICPVVKPMVGGVPRRRFGDTGVCATNGLWQTSPPCVAIGRDRMTRPSGRTVRQIGAAEAEAVATRHAAITGMTGRRLRPKG